MKKSVKYNKMQMVLSWEVFWSHQTDYVTVDISTFMTTAICYIYNLETEYQVIHSILIHAFLVARVIFLKGHSYKL